jgi:putative MFS transporter
MRRPAAKRRLVVIGLIGVSLATFAALGDAVVSHRTVLYVLLVVPVWGISTLNAVLAAYTAEIYPTVVRARGGGLSAGATKAGGVLVLAAAAIPAPSTRLTAAAGLIPMALSAAVLLAFGPETRRKQLERITAEELDRVAPPA